MCAKSNTEPSFYSFPLTSGGKVSHRISAEKTSLFCCFIISMMENAFLCFPLQSVIDYFFFSVYEYFMSQRGIA